MLSHDDDERMEERGAEASTVDCVADVCSTEGLIEEVTLDEDGAVVTSKGFFAVLGSLEFLTRELEFGSVSWLGA